MTVSDNNSGTLSVTEEYTRTDESTGNVFRNEYEAKGSAELLAYKELSGEELAPGTFTFRLTAEGNAPMPADPTAINGNSGDAATALFQKIDYTLADAGKTYTYYIQEVIPDEAVNDAGKTWKDATDAEKENGTFRIMGVTFDNHKVKVTVTVAKDQGNGTLATTVRYDNGTRPYTFRNKYEAEGTAILYAYKTVNGKAPGANEQFTFELYESDANATVAAGASPIQTVQNNGVMIVFAPVSYDQDDVDKTFYYVIREKVTDKKTGYVLDSHDCLAQVKVEKKTSDESKLVTIVEYSSRFSTTDIQDNVFRNTYSADGKLVLSAQKLLKGRSMRNGEFTFVLEDEAGNVISTKKTAGTGSSYTVVFDEIDYVLNSSRDDSGSYTYRIREVIPEGAKLLSDGRYFKDGMFYDAANVQVIDVTVVDDRDNSPGKLVVTARRRGETTAINSPAEPAATFRNEYEADGEISLTALKQLNGDIPKAGSFEFVLTARESGAPMPEDGVTTRSNRADGEVHFDTIHYTQDDIGKTYHYEIRETIPKDARDNGDGTFTKDGYTYDGHAYQVTVTVADKAQPDGTLVITTDPADLTTAAGRTFRNTYESKGSVTLQAQKSLNGETPEDGAFTFTLFDVTGIADYAALGTDTQRRLETRTNVGRNVSFSPINYTQDDARKVFSYLILENIPADAVAVDDETLVYKDAGFLDKVSHEWKKNGYIYDGHYEHVTVSLTDNNDGTITAVPVYDHEEGASFRNRYEAEGTVSLKAEKFLNGQKFTTPGVFSFSLTGVNGAPVPANTTAFNDEKGEAVFSEIGYTLKDAGKTYNYIICETIPDEAVNAAGKKYKDASQAEREAGVWTLSGLTYDGHESEVSVTLADQGDGTLRTDVVYKDEEGSTEKDGAGLFYNIYEASSSITLGARKSLNGEPAPAGKFTFVLKDETGKVLQEKVANGAEGAVVFDEIGYDLSDLTDAHLDPNGKRTKAFHYTIQEEIPENAKDADLNKTYAQATEQEKQTGTWKKDGITYDGHVMQVRVDVTDQGDGKLQAVSTVDPIEQAFFANKYEATGTTDFKAFKKYEGHELTEGQFSFTITALDGGKLPDETTVSNDAKGNVDFGSVEFTVEDLGGAKTKTWHYTIKENIPSAAVARGNNTYALNGITYDGHTANVTVTVTDNEDGTLEVERVYEEDKPLEQAVFTNSYAVSGDARLVVAKRLTGREADENEFTFRLYDADGTQLDEKKNSGEEVLFDSIRYYQDKDHNDADKDFTYKIREVIPDDAVNASGLTYGKATDQQKAQDLWTKNGVTYDGHEIKAEVQVRDNGRGSLVTRVTYSAAEGENPQAFVNEYNAYGSDRMMASKTFVGGQIKAGDFTFILEDASRTEIDRTQNDEKGRALFDEIVFDIEDAGETFVYYVREDIPKEAVRNSQGFLVKDGIIYDESVWAFTIQVTDNKDGTLEVTRTCAKVGADIVADYPEFVNIEEQSRTVLLEIAKQLNGALPTGHSFSYRLKDSAEDLFDPQKHLLETITTDSARVTFGELTMDKEGVFDYYMYEVIPDDARDESLGKTYGEATDAEKQAGTWKLNGYTYDTTVVHATVNVDSTADGGFTVSREYEIGDEIVEQGVIHNLYEAAGKVTLTAKKTAQPSGTKVPEGKFSFTLCDADGKVIETKANNADGLAAFDAIEYTEQDIGKTFRYTMQEVVPADAVNAAGTAYADASADERSGGGFVKDGWTYSAASYDLTVVVADKEAGKQDGDLVIHVTGAPALTNVTGQDTEEVSAEAGFVNTYTEGRTTTDFKALKILNGQTLAKDQFSFTITALDGGKLPAVTTVKNDADGNAAFGSVEYTEKDLGGAKTKTWNYSIKEDIPKEAADQKDGTYVLNGYTYDGHESKVAVTVTNNENGTLTISRVYDKDDKLTKAVFENTYGASGKVILNAKKTAQPSGTAVPAGKFSFTLSDADGKVLQTKTNGADGLAAFDAIEYTEQDIGKTIHYTMQEVVPADATNSTGKTYAEATAEEKKAGGFVKDGWTYSAVSYDVTVAVSDKEAGKQDGKLVIHVTGTPEITVTGQDTEDVSAEAGFVNTYTEGKTTTDFKAFKILNGQTLTKDQFSFTITALDGGKLPAVTTVRNDADGNAAFGSVEYTEKDLGGAKTKTWNYSIKEDIPKEAVDQKDGTYILNGYTYDGHESKVAVTVTNNENGTLSISRVYDEDNRLTEAVFENAYEASGAVILNAKKTAQPSGTAVPAGKFSFTLSDADGKVLQTKVNNADGLAAFDAIEYTEQDIGKTIHYTMQEVVPTDATNSTGKTYAEATAEEKKAGGFVKDGWTYSAASYDVAVAVADKEAGKQDGNLVIHVTGTPEITVTGQDTEEVSAQAGFVNTYTEGKTTTDFKAFKILNGQTLAKDQFSFTITALDGGKLPAVTTVKNDADGNAAFGSVEYTEKDLGGEKTKTWNYSIKEDIPAEAVDQGDDTYVLNGYTYDGHESKVAVTVTDNGNGTLSISRVYDEDDKLTEAVFENAYHAAGSVKLTAKKTAEPSDKKIAEGQFSFTLSDADGKVLQTKVNNADGLAAFDAIEYTEQDVGKTFSYTMQEVVPADATNSTGKTYADATAEEKKAGGFVKDGWTYSAASYDVTVAVADKEAGKQDGNLVIHVTGTPEITVTGQDTEKVSAEAGFVNTYTEGKTTTDFKAFKILNGQTLAKDQFSFTITALDGGKLPAVTTVRNDADGNAAFGSVEYTEKDLGGAKTKTWNYSIKEDIPTEAVDQGDDTYVLNGYTYDGHESKVVVTVTDNGNGTLTISRVYDEDDKLTEAVFENAYHAAGSVKLTAKKTAEPSDKKIAEGQFSFTLSDADGKVLQTKTNGADGLRLDRVHGAGCRKDHPLHHAGSGPGRRDEFDRKDLRRSDGRREKGRRLCEGRLDLQRSFLRRDRSGFR